MVFHHSSRSITTTDIKHYLSFFFPEAGLALEPVLELTVVDQAGLELTDILLLLPPECWD